MRRYKEYFTLKSIIASNIFRENQYLYLHGKYINVYDEGPFTHDVIRQGESFSKSNADLGGGGGGGGGEGREFGQKGHHLNYIIFGKITNFCILKQSDYRGFFLAHKYLYTNERLNSDFRYIR